jgi:hypothetical protein
MEKRYQIELDRNERDFATFLKRRDISLSKNELKVLIASKATSDQLSVFDTKSFMKKLAGEKVAPNSSIGKSLQNNI